MPTVTETIETTAPETSTVLSPIFVFRYLDENSRIAEMLCQAPNADTALSVFRQRFRRYMHAGIRKVESEGGMAEQLKNLRRGIGS